MRRLIIVMFQGLCLDPAACLFQDSQGFVVIVLVAGGFEIPRVHVSQLGNEHPFHIAGWNMLQQGIDNGGALLVQVLGFLSVPHFRHDLRLYREIPRNEVELIRDSLIGVYGLVHGSQGFAEIPLVFICLGEMATNLRNAAPILKSRGI